LTPPLYKSGDAELDAISILLTNGGKGRLQNALVRDKKLASSVSAYQQSMPEVSVFSIDATLNPNVKADDVIKAIDEVIAGLISSPPTNIELEQARNKLLTSFFFGLQNIGGSNGKAEILQNYKHFANNANFMQEDLARYRALDQKHLVKAVKDYLPVGNNRKILIANPQANQKTPRNQKS
jgi:predicted Zn-dependent peptidase